MQHVKTTKGVRNRFKHFFCKTLLKNNEKQLISNTKDDCEEKVEKITILNSDKTLEVKMSEKSDRIKLIQKAEECIKVVSENKHKAEIVDWNDQCHTVKQAHMTHRHKTCCIKTRQRCKCDKCDETNLILRCFYSLCPCFCCCKCCDAKNKTNAICQCPHCPHCPYNKKKRRKRRGKKVCPDKEQLKPVEKLHEIPVQKSNTEPIKKSNVCLPKHEPKRGSNHAIEKKESSKCCQKNSKPMTPVKCRCDKRLANLKHDALNPLSKKRKTKGIKFIRD